MRRNLWLAGAYLFLALGTLAKMPVARFLAAIIILPFLIIRRDWTSLRLTLWCPAFCLTSLSRCHGTCREHADRNWCGVHF